MPERILLVEDDEKSRRLLDDVLRFHGYSVMAVDSGERALREVPAFAPQAALLDIQLPGMTGFQMLEGLRLRFGAMPVIAVTASVMHHDRERILGAGFDAYIPKPVNIRQLLEILRAQLARRPE
jgi:two-component system cell cycle response regulator DivK